MTPYQKQKQRDTEIRIAHCGCWIIQELKANNYSGVIWAMGRRWNKEECLNYIYSIEDKKLISKFEDIVAKVTIKFNNAIELLNTDDHINFLKIYSIFPSNVKQTFVDYISNKCSLYRSREKTTDKAFLLISQINMICNAIVTDKKTVITIKMDKGYSYSIKSSVDGDILERKQLKRRLLTINAKEVKDGDFLFFNSILYKLVIISKSRFSAVNNIRLLKI